ncbi:MAG: hypothetical protein GX792_05945 [Bacteroidales bacterium]|nr:hypothetical protein [Bacteroidales bacterium]
MHSHDFDYQLNECTIRVSFHIDLTTERLIQTITDHMDISQITSNTLEARNKILNKSC